MLKKTKGALKFASASAAIAALSCGQAMAAHIDFDGTFTLTELNDSGVTGGGSVYYDAETEILDVMINASGLTPDQQHAQHIHGRFDDDGNPINSTSPTAANDAAGDNDGFIEVIEGVSSYGDVLLSLFETDTMFPTADSEGNLDFSASYDLSDASVFTPSPATGNIYEKADLFSLVMREIVLHGMVVAPGAGGGDGEVNGEVGGYIPILPVASAEISEVPVPAAAWLFATAGLGGWWRFGRKRKTAASKETTQ